MLVYKRVAVQILALMVILGLLPLTVTAEERTPYVFTYASDTCDQPYLYTTPFLVDHTIMNGDGSLYYSGENFPEIFNLVYEEAEASVAAYSADAAAGIRGNAGYRRINLEDSTYFDCETAGRIRAVVLNGFPMQTVETIQANANIWLRKKGLGEIENLQSGEAILATQIAIWKLANAEEYTVNAYCSGRTEMTTNGWRSYLANVVNGETARQPMTEHSAQNVECLSRYLYELDAAQPAYDAVSESTFENPTYTQTKEKDGTYSVTVTVQVNTTVAENDCLVLRAVCGEQVQSRSVMSAGEYSFTFTGLADRMAVNLQISGWQGGGDVYLFDAEGERSSAQTLVGYDNSRLPVCAESVVTPDRILNICKSTDENVPLANIEFNIYQVAVGAQLSEKPTQAEIAEYQNPQNLIAVLRTDGQGNAVYNFTENGKPDGVYMIVEQFSASTAGAAEPFIITVPSVSKDGNGYTYTVSIDSQNVTEPGPMIRLDVAKLDNNSGTFDVGEAHTWIIRGSIPSGLGTAREYAITDVLDECLTYEKGSPIVRLYTSAGAELTLKEKDHYTRSEGTVGADDGSSDIFSISLTPAGMAYAAANQGIGEQTPEVRIYFRAAINSSADLGKQISNQIHLDYTNSAGIGYDADSDTPEVHTGGIRIQKTNSDGTENLSGIFRIARAATEEEISGGESEILAANGEDREVIFVDFFPSEDMSGERVSRVSTDEAGRAVFYGLAYGTYYIVETGGYNPEPTTVEINEASHLTAEDGWKDENGRMVDNTVQVIGTKFILPDTGGMGIVLLAVTGLGIIGCACLLLIINRKRSY